jgi:aldehyde dehydrogenase (NAD+)
MQSCGWACRRNHLTFLKSAATVLSKQYQEQTASLQTEQEAVQIANDTSYGLQVYVLSSDVEHASAIAARLDSGRIQINAARPGSQVPFGGFKQSGIGREHGVFGREAHLERYG